MAARTTDRTAAWVVDQQAQSPLFGKLPAELRLGIFNLALEEYYERQVRHDFRLQHDHGCGSDDDGALSSSVESARFTDSEDDEGSDEESRAHEIIQHEPDVCPENSTPFGSMEFDESECDDSWHPDAEEDHESGLTPPGGYSDTFYDGIPWLGLSWFCLGSLGIPKISTSLLRTCRRAYLEARHMVAANYVHHIWDYRAPRRFDSEEFDAAARRYARLTPAQRNGITSAHLHCSDLSYGPGSLRELCKGPGRLLRRIEHLRISVAVPCNAILSLDPWRPDALGSNLRANMEATAGFGRGDPPPETPDAEWEPPVVWSAFAWADVFRYLPSLRTVTMDFDAEGQEREAVGETAEWASRVWRFPLGPRPDGLAYLSAQGNPVERTSWRDLPCLPWECIEHPGRREQGIRPDWECPCSSSKIVLLEKGLGARKYTWTIKWTARVGREWVPPKRAGRCPAGMAGVGGPNGKTTWDDV